MAHVLILGMTESGKTSLAKLLAEQYRRQEICVAVLDPLSDPGWKPEDENTFVTKDKSAFLRTVKSSRSLAVFADEGGETIGRYDDEMIWLATRGRHYGHSCHFLSQRGQLMNRTVRDQCTRLYLFTSAKSDGKIHADDWNQEELRNCHILKQYHFFIVSRFEPLRAGRLVKNRDGSLSVKLIAPRDAIRDE